MPEPGSAIGTLKLIETILSLGLAPLLEPWQKKRIGIADAHNHIRLKLADAQADKLIEDIRAGRKIYDAESGKIVSARGDEEVTSLARSAQISSDAAGFFLRSRALRDADDL